jgi:hypothetical protein
MSSSCLFRFGTRPILRSVLQDVKRFLNRTLSAAKIGIKRGTMKIEDCLKKTCSKCSKTKGTQDFQRDATKKDGCKSACRECLNVPEKKVDPLASVREALGEIADKERKSREQSLNRSVSLAAAREQIFVQDMERVSGLFKDKVNPVGYARQRALDTSQSACLFLSDLHLGSELSALDNPTPFGDMQESRRLEKILRDVLQKSDGRKELVHDQRDGLPLAEQQYVFWSLLSKFIGYLAAEFPKVRIFCQPGNHGRNKLRHHGRATSSKWDSFEWAMYQALAMMCSGLKNTTLDIPFRALSLVEIQGNTLLFTHGDTEIKIGDPDTRSKANQGHLLTLRESGEIEGRFDGACFGHFHKARLQMGKIPCLFNGALVPPNGYARTEGYVGERQGQFYFESERGNLFKNVEFLEVNRDTDRDSSLGDLLQPVRF